MICAALQSEWERPFLYHSSHRKHLSASSAPTARGRRAHEMSFSDTSLGTTPLVSVAFPTLLPPPPPHRPKPRVLLQCKTNCIADTAPRTGQDRAGQGRRGIGQKRHINSINQNSIWQRARNLKLKKTLTSHLNLRHEEWNFSSWTLLKTLRPISCGLCFTISGQGEEWSGPHPVPTLTHPVFSHPRIQS